MGTNVAIEYGVGLVALYVESAIDGYSRTFFL
ncbi:hypothetical protein SAHL_04940 [Salinisphaera orenii YIM 95161]|uniref:Uncharacterized protein n=1 Tax=Salinisphaera orenii YIM 95161 TaxID=1051139 RepID=A0A423Q266_9GAMM|nr:hypothetical protein SAHL_04940 [Salinisphaera halophila YIM 95161]